MEQQRDQHHGRENLDGGEKGAASPSMLSRMQHQARSIDAHAALGQFGGSIVFCHHHYFPRTGLWGGRWEWEA